MNRVFIGIDPGKNGGIAVIDKVEYLPHRVNMTRVYSDEILLKTVRFITTVAKDFDDDIICCLEKVGAMPGQGVVSMFNFGKSYGYIKGVLEAFGIPYQEVPPQRWKKEFGLTSDKTASVEVCRRLFPDVNLLATPRCKKPHDGMAEALLMAEYARRKL